MGAAREFGVDKTPLAQLYWNQVREDHKRTVRWGESPTRPLPLGAKTVDSPQQTL